MTKTSKPKVKVLDEVTLIKAATLCKGNKTRCAAMFHISRQAVQSWATSHPEVAAAFADAKESMLDRVESKAYAAAECGAPWAVSMVLRTQGQSRGWVEKRTPGNEGGPVEIVVKYADKVKPE